MPKSGRAGAYGLRCQGCDPEDAEPVWPLRPPDREEELQRRTQETGTRHECGSVLGRARVTKRVQRWAEVRRAGRRWVTLGEAEATCCLLRLRRGTPRAAPEGGDDPAAETGGGKPTGRAPVGSNKNQHPPGSRGYDLEVAEPGWPSRPPDREEELQRLIQATGTRRVCGPGLGRSGVTKRE
ncbi:hypothetical protein NDU88_006489 [Pleurodeles waltl]|uniref:Uncharacterized protein n=1 Tax=Pleurodeles waltl TaxID=8319 RepID=A0AAV7RQD3_PLEWA|nr:hypothetical protein NDU88_006489 [Pleurodeles waltl]